MIVLDTNVISELFKPRPDPKVMDWVAGLRADGLFTTAVTRGELLFGVCCMPKGRRRNDLLQKLTRLFEQRLGEHVLAYDGAAADAHAKIAAAPRREGRPGSQADMMIAGIARAHHATLATRNVRGFGGCGIRLVDPWH